jgi:hypothetical protein
MLPRVTGAPGQSPITFGAAAPNPNEQTQNR